MHDTELYTSETKDFLGSNKQAVKAQSRESSEATGCPKKNASFVQF